jgi:hypothetical protein
MTQRATMMQQNLVAAFVSRGYPGIHKLRASCYHPLLHRLALALGQTFDQVAAEWKLQPPKRFWPLVRMEALEGETNAECFVRLLGISIDAISPNPHPLLCPR